MTYNLELKPKIARSIEAEAASQGISPEEFLAGFVERIAQTQYANPEEVRQIADEILTKYARVFEALAKSEREDEEALLRVDAAS